MRIFFLIFLLFIVIIFPAFSIAEESGNFVPSIIKANELSNDDIRNIISAKGDVELIREGNTFYADKIVYKKNEGLVEADGKVRIKGKENNDFFANRSVVKDDISYGEFQEAGIIFEDGSFVYSPKIVRENNEYFIFQKPYYATCPTDLNIKYDFDKIIENTINKNHLFSIKSTKVNLNTESDSIYFYNAVFKIYGFPFFYLPYLKTVRPTVERKTGFSAPSYKNNNHFGYGIYVPYYIRISDNKNLTLTPLVYTKYWNYALETIYRHYLRGGEYNIIGSVANDKGASDDILLSNGLTRREERKDRDFGAYIQAIGAFELFNNWIVDFNGSLVSDEYYLRDYKNDYSDYLTHFINFQKVWQRNNLSIKALTFTEVNGSDREVNKTPVVLPMINSHVEGKTYNFVNKHIALRSELDSNFSVISRNEGLQYRRLTIKPNLYNSYIKWGNVIKFEMNLKSDFYSLDENYEEDDRDQIMEYDSFKSRFIPQAELEWSYPLARKGQIFNTRLLVEPIVKLISTPNSDYNNKYPNEDSKVTAISDSNLFSSNRFSGFDRVETGSRSAYGIKGGLYSADYGNFRFLIGQAYELKKDKNIEIRGFSDNFSDVVGGLSYSTDKIFDIYYRFRIDKVKYEARSHEVSSSFDFDYFDFGIDYTWLFPELDGDTEKEEITPSVGIKLPFNMHFNASITRDLFEEDVTISKNMELSYKGSCVFSSISLSEITPRDGSEKSRSITFNIKIQNQWL